MCESESFLYRPIEDTSENAQWEKVSKCNQCDLVSTLKSTLITHTGDLSNKCNQCDYASLRASHMKACLKMHSGENQTNLTSVTMHCDWPTVLINIWWDAQ